MDSKHLRDLLNHLYDPDYRPAGELLIALGLTESEGLSAARIRVLALIDSLKPSSNTPTDAAAWRLYRVLQARYVHGLTQREVAEDLAVAVRHLARLQAKAIDYLADTIRHRGVAIVAYRSIHAQIVAEVASLYEQADEAACEVAEVVQAGIELIMPLALARNVALHFDPPLLAVRTGALHAAVRQATVSALSYLVRSVYDGDVRLRLRTVEGLIELELDGGPVSGPCPDDLQLVHELLATAHGELVYAQAAGRLCLWLRLPPEAEVRVLVADDNSDQLHFYGRCVAGTRFSLVALRDGRRVLAAAREMQPDLIVLDVMLPNSDGWELLAQLANDPATRQIPVVVCSVVNEAELAVSLGATVTLAKPVSRLAFLAALQQARQSGARARR